MYPVIEYIPVTGEIDNLILSLQQIRDKYPDIIIEFNSNQEMSREIHEIQIYYDTDNNVTRGLIQDDMDRYSGRVI